MGFYGIQSVSPWTEIFTLQCKINVSHPFIDRLKFLPKTGQIVMLKCCNLPGNNLLSRFCFQNYFPCPNSHFRPCFIALCSLFLDFTSYPPPTIKTPFVYKALKSSNLPHISDALFLVFKFVSIFFLTRPNNFAQIWRVFSRICLSTVPRKAAITPEWPLLSLVQFTR